MCSSAQRRIMRAIAAGDAVAQRVGVGLQPLEEQARRGSAIPSPPRRCRRSVAGMQRAQESEVVQHRVRRGETTEQVLLAEGIDAVFHADAGIVLRRARWWECGYGACRGAWWPRRSPPCRARHRHPPPTTYECRSMPSSPRRCWRPRHQRRIVLHVLAAGTTSGRRDEFHRVGVRLAYAAISCTSAGQLAATLASTNASEAMTLARLAPAQRVHEYRIVAIERRVR